MDLTTEELELLASMDIADQVGRLLASHSLEKNSGVLSESLSFLGHQAGKLKNAITANPALHKQLIHGATIAGGVAGGLSDPGVDPRTGESQSRLLRAAGGAAIGNRLASGALNNLHAPGMHSPLNYGANYLRGMAGK